MHFRHRYMRLWSLTALFLAGIVATSATLAQGVPAENALRSRRVSAE